MFASPTVYYSLSLCTEYHFSPLIFYRLPPSLSGTTNRNRNTTTIFRQDEDRLFPRLCGCRIGYCTLPSPPLPSIGDANILSLQSFNDFSGFNCPDTTDNQCNTQQSSGFSWGDVSTGSSDFDFGGFSFSGFTCEEGYGKRAPGSRFAPRSQKVISGSCGHDTSSSPSFGCGSSSSGSSSYGSGSGSSYGSGGSSDEVSSFSVSTIEVVTEFDCDLEFHYSMEDGSTCKQRSSCSSEGSTVKNSQCGGAKNVTIVYPSGQTGSSIPKESSTCSVSIPTISFDCNSASSTVTKATSTGFSITKSTDKSTPTPTTQGQTTKEQSTGSQPTPSSPAESGPSTPSSPAETGPSPTGPAGGATTSTSGTLIASTSSTVVASTESSTESTPVAASTESTTSNSPVTGSAGSSSSTVESSTVESTTYVTSSTYLTSHIGTSTVYSTSVQTITSCAPTVTDCPARTESQSEIVTTVVIAVSTTICPVTETQTSVFTTSHAVSMTVSVPAASVPAESSATSVSPVQSNPAVSGSATITVVSGTTSTLTSVSTATQTLSYPSIVPACISTWNYIVGCVDNSDTSCYCPDSTFVAKVYDCLYAYGDSDETISEAVQYFQGLCGNYAGGNPAIVTGATVTTYLTTTVS